MDSFKKRKGLRQGGKEGLKTSARNPLPANTQCSDKSSHHLLSRKLFRSNHQILAVNAEFSAIFFAITTANAFWNSLKDMLYFIELFCIESPVLRKCIWLIVLKTGIKKGAEVRRRGVKFNTSARGFVLVNTSPFYRCSFSVKKH